MDLTRFNLTVGHAGYEILARPTTNKIKTRVMWMVRKESGLRFSVRDDVWSHPDASGLDVTMENGTTVRVVNKYHQERRGGGGWCLRQLPAGISRGQTTMILGDFNAHSNVWDARVRIALREEDVLDAMDREKMALINEEDRITRRGASGGSVLNLAWISEDCTHRATWELREEDNVGSDHAAIRIRLLQDKGAQAAPTSTRLAFQKADWEVVKEEAKKLVEREKGRWEEARRKGDVEEMGKILEECHVEAMEKGVPSARAHWRSKGWFREEVKAKRSKMAQQRRWARNSQEPEDHREWRRLRNDYFHTIRRKKREQWDKFVQQAEGGEMWGIWKMASTKRTSRTPTLVDPRTGDVAHTFPQKEEMLAKLLFPRKPAEPKTEEEEEPPPAAWEHQPVTNQEALKAIRAQGQLKAPGEDGVVSRVVTKCWDHLGEWVTEMYNAALEQGKQPARWKKAIVAVIPKPNKPDYPRPRRIGPFPSSRLLVKDWKE